VKFTVPGIPVPKERPRFGRGRVYTPEKTVAYERKVRFYAAAARVRPIDGDVALTLAIYLPDRRRRDMDNIEKAIKDALNGVAYEDDSQVAWCLKERFVDKADPRVVVTVEAAR
jgi:crossover junction endodeoxyribonuclease RusA